MLTYWVKREVDGWWVFLAGKKLVGPSDDLNGAVVAAQDFAKGQVSLEDELGIQVMVQDADGSERQAALYGGRPRGPRVVSQFEIWPR